MVSFTSNLSRPIREFLNLLLGQDAQHNNAVKTFLESFVGGFKGFGIDKTTIDLGPSCTGWDALFGGLFQQRQQLYCKHTEMLIHSRLSVVQHLLLQHLDPQGTSRSAS